MVATSAGKAAFEVGEAAAPTTTTSSSNKESGDEATVLGEEALNKVIR
jgi:hypothetical protein